MVVRFTSVQIICLIPKPHFETCFEVGDALRMDCILYTDSMFAPSSYKIWSRLCKQTTAYNKADFLIQFYGSFLREKHVSCGIWFT